jgi:hypothetical protein
VRRLRERGEDVADLVPAALLRYVRVRGTLHLHRSATD